MRETGKRRSANTERMTPPTCPVAPTMPTSTPSGYRRLGGWSVEFEVRVQGLHGPLDVACAHHTADANRRCGDHLDVDSFVGQHPEHLGGHAWVGLHAGTHDAHA